MRITESLNYPKRRELARRVQLAAVAAAVALTAACSAGSSAVASSSPSATSSGMAGMPGMTGSEHHGDPGKGLLSTEDGYTLKPSSDALNVGRQTVTFQILNPDGQPQADYVEDQTKQLHLYLIRLDLTGYQHLHPTLEAGTWTVDLTTGNPGPYRLYTDFIARDRAGSQHPLVLSTVLTAPGTYAPVTLPAPSTSTTAKGLTAKLSGRAKASTDSTLTFEISSGGKAVTDLEPYLDSYAHLTAVHAGDAAYQHLHPELTATPGATGGPALPFSVTLPEKGSWRLFLQVQRSGALILLPLTITVT